MTTSDASLVSSQQAKIVGSFASLLSCALNVTRAGVIQQPFQASAQQLALFVTDTLEPTNVCCIASSLQLRQQDAAFVPKSSKALMQDAAASNLKHPVHVAKCELKNLPTILLSNLSTSFMSLVESRLRSSLKALVPQQPSANRQDDALTRVLVRLLSASSNPIQPTMIVTTFRTLAFPETNAAGDCVLPLIMEAVIDLTVLGNSISVSVEAPGTIQGSFSPRTTARPGPAGMSTADIQIDTAALLASMMGQARIAARGAIGIATQVAARMLHAPASSSLSRPSGGASASNVPTLQQEPTAASAQSQPTARPEKTLMPPPPARASPRKERAIVGSTATTTVSNQEDSTDQSNPVSGVSGLDLLTIALSGIKRSGTSDDDPSGSNKKQRDNEETDGPFSSSDIQDRAAV